MLHVYYFEATCWLGSGTLYVYVYVYVHVHVYVNVHVYVYVGGQAARCVCCVMFCYTECYDKCV